MKKKVLILILMLSITFVGCISPKVTENNNEQLIKVSDLNNEKRTEAQTEGEQYFVTSLYFPSREEKGIHKELRSLNITNKEKFRAIVESLQIGPQNRDYISPIPLGIDVSRVSLENGVVFIDFTGDKHLLSNGKLSLSAVSIIKTLEEVEGVKDVKILVQGYEIQLPKLVDELDQKAELPIIINQKDDEKNRVENNVTTNSIISVTTSSLIKATPTSTHQIKTTSTPIKQIASSNSFKTNLYFGYSLNEKLIKETREIMLEKGRSKEELLIKELLKGTKITNHINVFPEGTKLYWVKTVKGLCTVNMSKEFLKNNMGSSGERVTLYSLVNSLTELEYIKQVKILIDGKAKEVYIHEEIIEPLKRDYNIIK